MSFQKSVFAVLGAKNITDKATKVLKNFVNNQREGDCQVIP